MNTRPHDPMTPRYAAVVLALLLTVSIRIGVLFVHDIIPLSRSSEFRRKLFIYLFTLLIYMCIHIHI